MQYTPLRFMARSMHFWFGTRETSKFSSYYKLTWLKKNHKNLAQRLLDDQLHIYLPAKPLGSSMLARYSLAARDVRRSSLVSIHILTTQGYVFFLGRAGVTMRHSGGSGLRCEVLVTWLETRCPPVSAICAEHLAAVDFHLSEMRLYNTFHTGLRVAARPRLYSGSINLD